MSVSDRRDEDGRWSRSTMGGAVAWAVAVAAVVVLGLAPLGGARAAPLPLRDLDALVAHVVCDASCTSAPEGANWEKNAVPPVDALDVELAYLEYWDDGDEAVLCYEDRLVVELGGGGATGDATGGVWMAAVVPMAECGLLDDCLSRRTATDCIDRDGDGLRRWQEELIGTSDSTPQRRCQANRDCDFFTLCTYQFPINRDLCMPRSCPGGACTAFHLEKVAEDQQEVIVHVHYDYSPVPARVLDLHIAYERAALTLIDARPLPVLAAAHKPLATSHTAGGLLRLTIIDPADPTPIPYGAIVELVFRRQGVLPARLAFTGDDVKQQYAIAPSQQNAASALTIDALWGEAVAIGGATAGGPQVLLHYDFESQAAPMHATRGVPAAAELCAASTSCQMEQDPVRRAKHVAMLGALQAGVVQASHGIDGVSGAGVYLDGAYDHLEPPVTYNEPAQQAAQAYSVGLWFYAEGDGAGDGVGDGVGQSGGSTLAAPQVVWSHNSGYSERSTYGLLLANSMACSGDTIDLVWFEGDFPAAVEEQVAACDIVPRAWTHVGLSVDGSQGGGAVVVYVDGAVALATRLRAAPALSCPALLGTDGVALYREGEHSGAPAPQVLYLADRKNNITGIERMDPLGRARREILRDGEHHYQDPDYHPELDKFVYSANVSGQFEIWVAAGDGHAASRQQLTRGFGDSARGIFARRPRWAPDGSAIIFESNIYSVAAGDNTFARAYHLYYLPYDRAAGVFTPVQLDYDRAVANITEHRVTRRDAEHTGVLWLRGRFDEAGVSYRGDILFNVAESSTDTRAIHRLRLPANLAESSSGGAIDLTAATGGAVRALASFRAVAPRAGGGSGTQDEVIRLFFAHEASHYEASNDFSYFVSAAPDGDGGGEVLGADGEVAMRRQVVTVVHTPQAGDEADHEARNLYLAFDAASAVFDRAASGAGSYVTDEVNGKLVELAETEECGRSCIRVEVRSPTNADDIPVNAAIARLVFLVRADNDAPGFELLTRVRQQTLKVKDLSPTSDGAVTTFHTGGIINNVTLAAYAPDGERLLLGGISHARPQLVLTARDPHGTSTTTNGAERITTDGTRVQGLSWSKVDRYNPCNWVGGLRQPLTKELVGGLRGGLDELVIYNYARSAVAFASDAARGHERLAAEGRDEPVASLVPTCVDSDAECPPYHRCRAGRCELVPCDWTVADSCAAAGGVCTLLPATLVPAVAAADGAADGEGDGPAFVCATECNTHRQCYDNECLNGPCRFCDETINSCIECRERTDTYGEGSGAFRVRYDEGCPDRNSFRCADGSCLSDCYSFDNNESEYLCDPALEYCSRGRCVLFDWDWTDLAPATLSGLGETAFALPELHYTRTASQLQTIQIRAYGVEDYLHPPELLVEGRVDTIGAQVYGGEWFRVGRLLINHATKQQAQDGAAYVLQTPYPLTALRLRLVTPAYENLNAAATGMLDRDEPMCRARARAWAVGRGGMGEADAVAFARRTCALRAAGSRFSLGYGVGIARYAAYQACAAHGHGACPVDNDMARKYLFGGQPAVFVTEVLVGGASPLLTDNKRCAHAGNAAKVFYGDIGTELSAQASWYRQWYCAGRADCVTATPIEPWDADRHGGALLNCNYANPDDPDDVVAATYAIVQTPARWPIVDGAVQEFAQQCLVNDEPACFEWTGADVVADGLGNERELYHTLDFDLFRSFGYDATPEVEPISGGEVAP